MSHPNNQKRKQKGGQNDDDRNQTSFWTDWGDVVFVQ